MARDGNRPHGLLVVDDEEDFRDALRRYFQKKGFQVFLAEDGAVGLETYRESKADIDLVITDIRMPNMDGVELIRRLHAMSPSLPIIGVTGWDNLKAGLEAMGEGAYYYFEKPIDELKPVEALVKNAIRLFHYEAEIVDKRAKELTISQLMRSYMVKSPLYNRSPEAGRVLDIALESVPRDQPSGDFVEWFERGEQEVLFYIADAVGHDDVVATFLACVSNMVLHRIHHRGLPSIEEIVREVDGLLAHFREHQALTDKEYLTFFMGSLQPSTGELVYVSAGHPDVLLFGPSARERNGQAWQCLGSTCLMVGQQSLLGGAPVVATTFLRPGDTLLIYTDGASELLQGDDRPADGIRRVAELAEPLLAGSAEEIVQGLAAKLKEHAGPAGLQDDTTLMAIKVLPTSS